MGIFTWTDASVKNPKCNKWGDYRKKDVLQYGSFGKLVCPDDTELVTEYYNGYGTFSGHDAYDLVAEWNREDLPAIFEEIVKDKDFGKGLVEIVKLFAKGVSDDEITEYVRKRVEEGRYAEFLIYDWKRNIGIAIACKEKRCEKLRYPIKITTTREKVRYNDLYPSFSTQ